MKDKILSLAYKNKQFADILSRNIEIFKVSEDEILDIAQDSESKEYCALDIKLKNQNIKFRIAKVTPTKIGHFVTFWKRPEKEGPIMPYDISDSFDLLVVNVIKDGKLGYFAFPKDALEKHNIIASGKRSGKRAMRIYAPWDKADNPQAQRSQKWQVKYFTSISS